MGHELGASRPPVPRPYWRCPHNTSQLFVFTRPKIPQPNSHDLELSRLTHASRVSPPSIASNSNKRSPVLEDIIKLVRPGHIVATCTQGTERWRTEDFVQLKEEIQKTKEECSSMYLLALFNVWCAGQIKRLKLG